MTKFAAKFGRTRQDLANSPQLHRQLLERYAKEHGHDTTGLDEWVMIVSENGQVEFFPYWVPEDPEKNYDRGWTDRTPLRDPPLPLSPTSRVVRSKRAHVRRRPMKKAVRWEERAYRGFACPQETFSPELLELVVVGHARALCRAFLEKFSKDVETKSDGLVPAISKWSNREAALDDAWTLGMGWVRAAMREGGDTESVPAAAQFGLDILARGTPGAWRVRLVPGMQLRWGRWLLPAAEELTVTSDGRCAMALARENGSEARVALRWSNGGWDAENADVLPSARFGESSISVLAAQALTGAPNDDVRPRLNRDIPMEEITSSLERASEMLGREAPSYSSWVSRVIRGIIPFHMTDDMYLSGSHPDRPGVVTCSFPTPTEMLCELLVHEASHQYFHILTKLGDVEDGSDTTLYYSPARRMHRPLLYILLAYHAVANMTLFWRGCLNGKGPFPDHCRERERELTDWARQLEAPLHQTTSLTALGNALWEPLAERL